MLVLEDRHFHHQQIGGIDRDLTVGHSCGAAASWLERGFELGDLGFAQRFDFQKVTERRLRQFDQFVEDDQ